ncbi:MAG: double-strand break repair helicase AddA [Paracoccaceae bacterium]
MTLDDATLRQIEAADPNSSVWLSANAGSGKTRVLTDRVARLLLEDVSPQHILCLTYTTAAASEMQNRLFKRLGEWSMMDDQYLSKELANLGSPICGRPDQLAHARTLFARAIETPGGLRIQTIHSFCSSLLKRFPLEAGVSPVFREIEDRAATLLRDEIVEELAGGPLADAVHGIARHYTGDDLGKLMGEILKNREALATPMTQADVWAQLGLPEGFDTERLLAEVFLGGEQEFITALIPILETSTKARDQKAAKSLAAINLTQLNLFALEQLVPVFLTTSGNAPFTAKVGSFPTKDIRGANPEIVEKLNALMERVEATRERQNCLGLAQRTFALREFASEFLPRYEARKTARGWLDFDDLIFKARALLSDPAVAQWVLFRLDGGIDHILVEEAQDPRRDQWQVIKLLAQEFSVGQGARADILRTIFVVGDLKQSIYSFQGADPREFDRMREHFADRLGAVNQTLLERSLNYSFRSSPAILGLVDATFRETDGQGVGGPPHHIAFHSRLPGRVDLWPIVPKSEAPEEKNWYDTTTSLAANDHRIILAENIADQIFKMVNFGSITGKNNEIRPIHYGDILILVQRRSALFHEIIRTCKSRGLPIAGADRLKVGAELAVKDLTALLAFLALPDDDLSLAATLRSPLFGMTEAQLFDLANARREPRLWPALAHRKIEFPQIFETLSALRKVAEFVGPYELLERILTRHHGRQRLLARLGSEAEDGIDALLSQAITYEHTETPSLTGFLVWLQVEEVEIKRQPDSAGDRIRVMTTHGAKGLESPIVILPDTGDRRPNQGDELMRSDTSPLMWRANAAMQPKVTKEALTKANLAQDDERMRLLYVALTRAEKWLIVCASGNVTEGGNSWYQHVETGLLASGAQAIEMPTGPGLRLQYGDWPAPRITERADARLLTTALPIWATTQAEPPPELAVALAPSDLAGAKSLHGESGGLDDEAAMLRGRQLHRLLEHLPRSPCADWPDIARQILGFGEDAAAPDAFAALLSEATAVINSPELAHVFAHDVLAEVGISAELPELAGQRIHGTIDRLIVSADHVLTVDFKSNQVVPARPRDVPDGILRQMGAYLAALEQVYPDRQVDTAILWTRTAKLMPLAHDIVRAVLMSATPS